MTWNRPLSIFELAFILTFVLLYAIFLIRNQKIAKALQSPSKSVLIKLMIRSAYFALLLIALLGPSFGETKKEIKAVGKDIYIAVDLSESMNATDIQPSRIEKVKYELKHIINAFSSDRIGLIIFSSDAFVQCPLTFDQNALSLFIGTLSTKLIYSGGTDFSAPLKLALEKITETDDASTKTQSKVIILISDGEDFGEDTKEYAQKIEDSGIKLITLGVGTKEGSYIPTRNGFKKDNEGKPVVTTLNSADLQDLALTTGGDYFEVNNDVNEVDQLINTISQIEGDVREVKKIDISANKFFYFLLVAFVLIGIDVLVTVRIIKI